MKRRTSHISPRTGGRHYFAPRKLKKKYTECLKCGCKWFDYIGKNLHKCPKCGANQEESNG